MIVQGLLLLDPEQPPQPGWLRLAGGGIDEVRLGALPGASGPPDLGGPSHIITPAFYDAHTHLPQTDSVGCDGLPLLDWLDRVIFPAEAWWGRGGAVAGARTAAARLLGEGTAGMAAYLTSHGEAARDAAGFLQTRTPLRFIVGRVAMDRHAPEALTGEDRARARLRPVPSPIMPDLPRVAAGSAERHRVSAMPRFAVSCSDELLAEIGWALRDRPGLFVQTHLSESRDELEAIARLFPGDPHYTAVYDRFGLLTERTLLAHCIHLSDEEWSLIRKRGCIPVHCPQANIFLQAGLFSIDAAERHGVEFALGSDVAAGADCAMPRVARAMIETAKVRRMTSARAASVRVPTPAEAWRRITSGNAALLGWPECGRLEPGAAADLLVLRVPDSWVDEHLVGRLIYNWSPGLIAARVINGGRCDPSLL
ncbi:MAG: amidohydrolase family protein [Phycisphaerales bacterium]|nr:amidohydrolase family protein [Phycisphaerales bacterium]